MSIIEVYSNHCPRCERVADWLKKTDIKYTLIDNQDAVYSAVFQFNCPYLPLFVLDGRLLSFDEMTDYIYEHTVGEKDD